jgi:hypothetical protein
MGKENEKWEADVLVCSKLRERLFSLDKDKKKLVWGLSISQYGGIFFGAMMNKCWSQQKLMHGGGVGDG